MYVFLRPLVVFKWDGLACHKTRFNHTVGSILSSARPKSGQYNHCSYLYIVSVFLSCVHVYFFLVVGCFGYFCFQVHSFQLQFCTPCSLYQGLVSRSMLLTTTLLAQDYSKQHLVSTLYGKYVDLVQPYVVSALQLVCDCLGLFSFRT